MADEFLVQVKLYLAQKNRETQAKLNQLAMQQRLTCEFVKKIISISKQQVDDEGLSIFARVKAAEYIKSYRQPFAIARSSTNPDYIINIRFPGSTRPEAGAVVGQTEPRQERWPETVDDFAGNPVMYSELHDFISAGEDSRHVGQIYREYMSRLCDSLMGDDGFFKKEADSEQRKRVFQEVETHVAFRMYPRAFPKAPSTADVQFCRKMQLLQWIDPACLGVRPEDLKVAYWRSAADSTFSG